MSTITATPQQRSWLWNFFNKVDTSNPNKKLSLKNKIGYMFGDIGNNMSFALSSTFFMAFYVDVIGVSAAAVGILFLVARIWDGCNDPIMGTIAERAYVKKNDPKADKYRPYLLKGTFSLAAAAVLMFLVPDSLESMNAKIAWMSATYIIWGMCYTFVNIPYGSLASSMTQDAAEGLALSNFRVFGAILAGTIIKTALPIAFVIFADDMKTAYLVGAVACSILAISSHTLAFLNTKENIKPEPQPMTPFKEQIRSIFTNRLLIAAALAGLVSLTALYGISGVLMFYIRSNLDNAMHILAYTGFIDLTVMALIIKFSPKLVDKFGNRLLILWCCAGSLIFCSVGYFLVSTPTQYLIFYCVEKVFSMFSVGVMWALVADCIEYNHYKTGKREAGVIYSAYSLSRKLAGALAGLVGGVGVTLVGYNATLATQTLETQQGLHAIVFLMPAVAAGLMWLIFKFIWNLTPEKREEMVKHNQAMMKLGDKG